MKKKKISSLLSNKGKEQTYKFFPSAHSGKHSNDIEQDLNEKKKSLEFLASPQNKLKYLKIKKNTLDVKSTLNSSRRISDDTFSLSKNNSYMSKFEARRGKRKILTEPGEVNDEVEGGEK